MTKQRTPKRPRGYWEDDANIERELRAWIEKHGTFPTQDDLRRTEESSLAAAMVRVKGLAAWRERLGYAVLRKENGYWADEANVERELRAWIEKHGRFPKTAELRDTEDTSLAVALSKTGGSDAWRRRLGYVIEAKPRGYWDDEANVERELRAWIEKHGKFPSSADLKASKDSSLVAAMHKHGGFPAWRARLGTALIQRSPGYWDDEANVERELRAWIEKHGAFPTSSELERTGSANLGYVIGRLGGMNAWRTRLGFDVTRHTNGYWKDAANVERELRAWIEKHGKFPTTNDLARTGLTSLNAAILQEGFSIWRERLGHAAVRKPRGYWDDAANIERELRAWIEKHGSFPDSSDLERAGRHDLKVALSRYGGLTNWRAKLGYGPITPECLREYADVLARVVMALNVVDTGAFWTALQSRWTMRELTEAIREYTEEDKLERFRELLNAAD